MAERIVFRYTARASGTAGFFEAAHPRLRSVLRTFLWVGALLIPVLQACDRSVPQHVPEVLRVIPHDPGAYTQGLVLHEGRLFESTGQYGSSTLRELDPVTGEVLRSVDLPEEYFGEGLAMVNGRLIQLTWREGVALVWDPDSFDPVDRFEYEGEGWGLCHDGESLFMTTGGSFLHRRDPVTFAVVETIQILMAGRALRQVNELACVGDHVYGNVYMTDQIVRIDKRTGQVTAEIDGSGLHPVGGRPLQEDAVLNGITYDPATGNFYLTGKLWGSMFEVRFTP